jgi:transcriptional regulator with XRE-family HTH domain
MDSDRGEDVIMDCLHTRFLVSPLDAVNKETCLAAVCHGVNLTTVMNVAANLRRYREEAGLSQVELADLAGVSQQLVSQIERGKNVSTKYLPQIAGALRKTVGELDPSYRTGDVLDNHLVREIAELAAQLSETERRLLLGAAQGLIEAGKAEG